jgi:hypothetical protein
VGEMTDAYPEILKRKRPVEKLQIGRKIILKLILKKRIVYGLDLYVAEDKDHGRLF